jgi:hypothetical protein
MSVILYKNFDINALSPCEVMKNKSGGNQVSLKYNDLKRILLQVPAMNAPFGISEYVLSSVEGRGSTGAVKYSIDFSFKGHDSDPKIASFMQLMRSLDEFMISLGVDHS